MATGGVANVLHACRDDQYTHTHRHRHTHIYKPQNDATAGTADSILLAYYRAGWITTVGLCFCLLNVAFFVMNCILLSCRFYMRPGTFTRSFTDQVESLFIPAFVSLGLKRKQGNRA